VGEDADVIGAAENMRRTRDAAAECTASPPTSNPARKYQMFMSKLDTQFGLFMSAFGSTNFGLSKLRLSQATRYSTQQRQAIQRRWRLYDVPEFECTAYLEFEDTTYLEFEGTTYLEFEGTTYLEFEGTTYLLMR
jgi:hypothetical protein